MINPLNPPIPINMNASPRTAFRIPKFGLLLCWMFLLAIGRIQGQPCPSNTVVTRLSLVPGDTLQDWFAGSATVQVVEAICPDTIQVPWGVGHAVHFGFDEALGLPPGVTISCIGSPSCGAYVDSSTSMFRLCLEFRADSLTVPNSTFPGHDSFGLHFRRLIPVDIYKEDTLWMHYRIAQPLSASPPSAQEQTSLHAYPSLVTESLNVEISTANPGIARLAIVDPLGKVVWQSAGTSLVRGKQQWQVDAADWEAGAYSVLCWHQGTLQTYRILKL